MTMKEMIAYCGLDCEKCDAYLATINNDQHLREKTAELWAAVLMGLKLYTATAFALSESAR